MFSPLVEQALRVTVAAHEGQYRKGAEVVHYATHPLHIALMLARWGFDQEVVAAGLLHDVVEDCEGWAVERVEAEFGTHVASIVRQLTEDKSRTWEERKRWAVEHVPQMSPEAASVKAVDKLHNFQCLLAELRAADDVTTVWARFTGGRERTLEMDAQLVAVLVTRVDPRLGKALEEAHVAVIEHDRRTYGVRSGS